MSQAGPSALSSAFQLSFRAERQSSPVLTTLSGIDLDQPSTSKASARRQVYQTVKKQPKPAEKPSRNRRTCKVCNTHEQVGIHFGTVLCEPCDAFWRKCMNDPVSFYLKPCITRKQKCPVTEEYKKCHFCRAKRCLIVGLNRNKLTENGRRIKRDCSDQVLKPQKIGFIGCEEMVGLLKKASHWGKPSLEKQRRMRKYTREAIRMGLTKKWYGIRRPGIHYEEPEVVDEPVPLVAPFDQPPILPPNRKALKGKKQTSTQVPRPILPKTAEFQPIPSHVILIQVPPNTAEPSPAQINAIVSSLSSAGVVSSTQPQQITITVRQPDLTAEQVGKFLTDSFSNALERVRKIRFDDESPLFEFLDASSNKAKRFLYNSSERPVRDHWRRIEAHINDLLCLLVKFAKLLPDFDHLSGDDQHALLSGTLLEMLFISSVFFIDDPAKRFYLNSGCVYSLPYLAYVFSGCSGGGDFFRSLFDFCRRLQVFVAFQDDLNKISYDRLGLVLALTLFSPSPVYKIQAEESQKQILAILKAELGDDSRLTSLLECLSCLSSLTSKHKRMVTSIRDDAQINLAVDLHAELLQLPPKRGNLSNK